MAERSKGLADFFVSGAPLPVSVKSPEPDVVKINTRNIEVYPDAIGNLTETSWLTSICSKTDNGWVVLVDLITSKGEVSDLVLHASINADRNGFTIVPGLIYVP